MAEAYCVKCRKTIEVKDPKTVILKNKSLAISGTCPVSGTKVFRFIKRHMDPIYALKIAIEREADARDFYLQAADKTQDKDGKKMLKWLAQEEAWHKAGLEKQLKSMMDKSAWQEWKEDSKPITENELPEISEMAHTREATSYKHITGGEVSALRTAARAEQKAIEFYRDFAEATTDPAGKAIFNSLVKQEQGHLHLLGRAMKTVKAEKKYFMLPRFL